MTTSVLGQWVLPLPYSSPPLSLNLRMHPAKERAAKRQLKADAHYLAHYRKVTRGCEAIFVTFVWVPKTKRTRDTDNPVPTIKALIDGLVQYGVVVDDDSEHVAHRTVIRERNAERKPGMWLIVTQRIGETVSIAPDVADSLLR